MYFSSQLLFDIIRNDSTCILCSIIVCQVLTSFFNPVEIQEMVNTTQSPEQIEIKRNILLRRHKEELKQTDMKLVIQLDQKVSKGLRGMGNIWVQNSNFI